MDRMCRIRISNQILISFILLILSIPVNSLSAPRPVRRDTGPPTQLVPKFPFPTSGLRLERRTRPGAFLDVLGRKSAVFGYEQRQLEAWAYPLQILDGFEL